MLDIAKWFLQAAFQRNLDRHLRMYQQDPLHSLRNHIPEHTNLHSHRHDSLKSHTAQSLAVFLEFG